jgi:flagellar biosynthesis protein FlhF
MQTKVYFASSIPAALEVARQDLGDDAMLVDSRPAPPEMRQYGRLEVTFAWAPPLSAGKESLREPPVSQLDEIRQQLASLRLAIGGQAPIQPAENNWISEKLAGNGFSRDLAEDLAAAVFETADDSGEAIVRELTRRIPAASPIESRTIAFIGPPGRGKTTSLVKVAMNFGLLRHIPVRIYTAGEHGIGAREQMARFAAILGTPWQSCESLATLSLALNGDTWKGLILIDTPGISPAEGDELSELSRFFLARPEIEKHLVLRAEATSADMLCVISRFSCLKPTRLLFTGVDEASSVAPMVETLIRCGVSAAFAGTGQQIPEDLAELNAESLARSAWTGDTTALTIDRARFNRAAA